MSWQELLGGGPERRVLPWTGGRALADRGRAWTIEGRLPPEHGWHTFSLEGARRARWTGPAELDPAWEEGRETLRGYLVGDRLIPDGAAVVPDPDRVLGQTVPVALVEPGQERFARALVARDDAGPWIWLRAEFPLGPEAAVADAFADRVADLGAIKGVTPALELAFRFCVDQRDHVARRRAEAERARIEAERARTEAERARREAERAREEEEETRRRAVGQLGTGRDRRALAARDFEAAAAAALRLGGAELLDEREARGRGERVVRFRFRNRRFECVVEEATLRIVDAGICLVDHETGERGDGRFTLESLPAVIDEALREDVLVVFRHAE